MEAHEAYERFNQQQEAVGHLADPRHTRMAALVVAVLAGFLAIFTFLSNEAIKEVITSETQIADKSALLEANEVKVETSESAAQVLEVVGAGSAKQRHAAEERAKIDHEVAKKYAPVDAHLREEIATKRTERNDYNDQHLLYELAQVGLQIGIVLASVSIIAAARWLLIMGGASGALGVLVGLAGLLLI